MGCDEFLLTFSSGCSCRDQPGDGGEPGGHRQHAAGAPDAEILEGEAPGPETTGGTEKNNTFYFVLLLSAVNCFLSS